MRALFLILGCILITGCVSPGYVPRPAGGYATPLPPKEFDHANHPNIQVIEASSLGEVFERCGRPPVRGILHGCAIGLRDGISPCTIIYVRGAERVMRHERGHCNGWPADHPNPRFFAN